MVGVYGARANFHGSGGRAATDPQPWRAPSVFMWRTTLDAPTPAPRRPAALAPRHESRHRTSNPLRESAGCARVPGPPCVGRPRGDHSRPRLLRPDDALPPARRESERRALRRDAARPERVLALVQSLAATRRTALPSPLPLQAGHERDLSAPVGALHRRESRDGGPGRATRGVSVREREGLRPHSQADLARAQLDRELRLSLEPRFRLRSGTVLRSLPARCRRLRLVDDR